MFTFHSLALHLQLLSALSLIFTFTFMDFGRRHYPECQTKGFYTYLYLIHLFDLTMNFIIKAYLLFQRFKSLHVK